MRGTIRMPQVITYLSPLLWLLNNHSTKNIILCTSLTHLPLIHALHFTSVLRAVVDSRTHHQTTHDTWNPPSSLFRLFAFLFLSFFRLLVPSSSKKTLAKFFRKEWGRLMIYSITLFPDWLIDWMNLTINESINQLYIRLVSEFVFYLYCFFHSRESSPSRYIADE